MTYPYYLVVSSSGRLPTPIQYKHTPIDKLFKSGKIGGVRSEEYKTLDYKDAQAKGLEQERLGKKVDVYKVERMNSPRFMCRLWRSRNWNGE